MAIAVRERIGELAVLKAVGYSDRFVLFLVLAESLFVAIIGGAIGIGLSKLWSMNGDPTGMLQSFFLPVSSILLGMAAAFGVGILSGILPATTAMRLRVVDALRRV
jgi:putative ABC transport system permease protein